MASLLPRAARPAATSSSRLLYTNSLAMTAAEAPTPTAMATAMAFSSSNPSGVSKPADFVISTVDGLMNSDCMIVTGTLTNKMVPALRKFAGVLDYSSVEHTKGSSNQEKWISIKMRRGYMSEQVGHTQQPSQLLGREDGIYTTGYRSSSHHRFYISRKNTVNCAHGLLLCPKRTGHLVWSAQQSVRSHNFHSAHLSSQRAQQENTRKDIAAQDEDPFDPLTDKIPQRPVTFAEGASYSVAIFAGFAVAAAAAYAVFKELIFQPKEYKIFGMALERVQHDSQVTVRLGTPITGYGQESRNRAARQRIPHRSWVDEDGTERIEVQFFIRGPHGAGKVHCEMFKDKVDKKWKFTYLIVDILSPSPTRVMLESYVPT